MQALAGLKKTTEEKLRNLRIFKAHKIMDEFKINSRKIEYGAAQHERKTLLDIGDAEQNRQKSAYLQELQSHKMFVEKRNNADVQAAFKEQQKENMPLDSEMKCQIQKEKEQMQRKREHVRACALEAMKMSEQRRLRAVVESKHSVVDQTEERFFKVEEQCNTINKLQLKSNTLGESATVHRDISTRPLKFTPDEQKKVERERAAKRERIEAYQLEVEQKIAGQRFAERRSLGMAQRLEYQKHDSQFKRNTSFADLFAYSPQKKCSDEVTSMQFQRKSFGKPLLNASCISGYYYNTPNNQKAPRSPMRERMPMENTELADHKTRMIAAKPFVPNKNLILGMEHVKDNIRDSVLKSTVTYIPVHQQCINIAYEWKCPINCRQHDENVKLLKPSDNIRYNSDEIKRLNHHGKFCY